jgi:hypothetical protein
MDHGGQPIHLGDVLAALGEATENINRLQAENEKLWKVAMKDAPAQQPPTVIVQQSAPPKPSPFEKYLLLRSLVQPAQPYRLPPPIGELRPWPYAAVARLLPSVLLLYKRSSARRRRSSTVSSASINAAPTETEGLSF